jgi:hypothetical protein
MSYGPFLMLLSEESCSEADDAQKPQEKICKEISESQLMQLTHLQESNSGDPTLESRKSAATGIGTE